MAILLATALQIVLLAQITKACQFKAPPKPSAKELKLPGPWNDGSFKRYFSSCECGKEVTPGQIPTWALYIHTGSHICSETIVTSNLVATSHECVRSPNKRLNVYDAWNISADYKAFEKVSDIRVTSSGDATAGETFPVLQLIPNPQFLLSWRMKSLKLGYDSLDLLLIKVKADFTSHKQHSPICILEDSDDLDFVEQTAYYNTNNEDSAPGNIYHETHEGVIFTQKMCESAGVDRDLYLSEPGDREKHDELSGLCFRRIKPAGFQPSELLQIGSPLFLKSASGHAFLVGVASDANITTAQEPSESLVDYARFSNIIPMIKYLEYRAHQHQSTWCGAPKFEDKLPLVNGRRWVWPWESKSTQKAFKGRNETLDCVCGVPGEPGPPMWAGKTTTDELRWMAVVGIYGTGGYCGATVVNDRMILTAHIAHCFVPEANFKTGQPIKPEQLYVIVDIDHVWRNPRRGVERVIVHPNFAVAAAKKNLDYDIALLILKDKVEFGVPNKPFQPEVNIFPICLPKTGEVIKLVGENATVAGWGLTIHTDERNVLETLQKLDVPIHPPEVCKDLAPTHVTDRFLCAGTLIEFIYKGKADSGGPLSIMRGSQWTEVGIVSWGESTGSGPNNRNVSLYTSVINPDILHFIDYFAEQTGVQWCKSETSG